MWIHEAEVDRKIKAAIDGLFVYENVLYPEKSGSSSSLYACDAHICIVQAFYALNARHQELLDFLGVKRCYNPPKSESYKLVKKGKLCPSSK